MAVTAAASFQAVGVKDKEPTRQPAGGKSFPGSNPVSGGSTPTIRQSLPLPGRRGNSSDTQSNTTISGGTLQNGGAIPGKAAIPKDVANPATAESSIFDRWGNLRRSLNTAKISVEPGGGTKTISENGSPLPLDRKETVKLLNPQPNAPGQKRSLPCFDFFAETSPGGKTSPLAVPKNGNLSFDLPKGQPCKAGDNLHSFFQAKNRGDLSSDLLT